MSRTAGPIKERFMSKVQVGTGDECWIWTGQLTDNGYGTVFVPRQNGNRSRQQRAHRVSFTLFNGEIPPGMMVCHRCDNPPCVNPAHLFLGTAQDNANDCVSKGRTNARKGENSVRSKLTEAQVIQIRHRFHNDGWNKSQLSREYGVSHRCIYKIIHNETWQLSATVGQPMSDGACHNPT